MIGSGYTTTYGPMNGKIDGIRITKAERYTGTSTTEWGNYSQPSAEWDYVGRTYTGTTTVLDKMGGGLVRFGDTSANNPLLKLETSGSTAAAASTIAKYDIADTTQITGTTNLDDNLWHHLAVSRTGTNTKLFVDGTQEGSTYVAATNLVQSGITIGSIPESTTTSTSTVASTLGTGLISFWNLNDSLASVYHDSSGAYTFTNDSRTFSTTQKLLGTHSLAPKTASNQNGLWLASSFNSSDWLDDTAFSFSYWVYRVDHVGAESVDIGFRKGGNSNALYTYWYAGSGSPYFNIYSAVSYTHLTLPTILLV